MKEKVFGKVRIIGGVWRGRKIDVPSNTTSVRPTSDRIRETLFNWLAPYIEDASCLDLYAGSGILGFEALSRGARFVTFIDHDQEVVRHLNRTKTLLQTTAADIVFASIPEAIGNRIHQKSVEIVFLDPPFHRNMVVLSYEWLIRSGCLAKHALIYLETEAGCDIKALQPMLECVRSKQAGQVRYHLLKVIA